MDSFWNKAESIPECGCMIWKDWTDRDGYGETLMWWIVYIGIIVAFIILARSIGDNGPKESKCDKCSFLGNDCGGMKDKC